MPSPSSAPRRNDPCPCGSGRKYKRCCLDKDDAGAAASAARRPTPSGGAGTAGAMRDAWAHQRAGRRVEAAGLYRRVLETEPEHPAALFGLGQVVGDLGDLDQGVDLLRRSIAATPAGADPRQTARKHIRLAVLESRRGRLDPALASAAAGLALDPDAAEGHAITATCHYRMNRHDAAEEAAARALTLDPANASAALIRGQILRRQRELDAARAVVDDLAARIDADHPLHKNVMHERGMILDGLGDHAAAYEAFRRYGREERASPRASRIDREDIHRRIARYRAGFTPEIVARTGGASFDDPAPAFLVGFPRSGTTMTEQVLAAHPDVVTTDEEPILDRVRERMTSLVLGDHDEATCLARLDHAQIRGLRAFYWAEAGRALAVDLGGRLLVDKQPLNLIDAGLINVLFPDARLIVALRDPRDVCVSCFMQSFLPNLATINMLDLEGTVRLYVAVMGLWLHVRPMLTVPCREIRYEDTVRDLEGQARRLLQLLDLPWNPEVLRFHDRARARYISTPSFATVVKPVHTGAIGRWRRYAEQLEPLQAALAPFVAAFGYAREEGPGD